MPPFQVVIKNCNEEVFNKSEKLKYYEAYSAGMDSADLVQT